MIQTQNINRNYNKNNNSFWNTHIHTPSERSYWTAYPILLAAINNHLAKECTFFHITVAPGLMEYPKNQLTIEGSNVTFSCVASGVPWPRISWTINGTAINVTANPRINLTADGQQLTVTNVNRTDSGEYRCVASNSNLRHEAHKTHYKTIKDSFSVWYFPLFSTLIILLFNYRSAWVPYPATKWDKDGRGECDFYLWCRWQSYTHILLDERRFCCEYDFKNHF